MVTEDGFFLKIFYNFLFGVYMDTKITVDVPLDVTTVNDSTSTRMKKSKHILTK